jgi:L-fuculose-phosphate aldolase
LPVDEGGRLPAERAPAAAAAREVDEDGPGLRAALIATARAMAAAGLAVNKEGNVSARCRRGADAGLLVTPSGLPYASLREEDIVFLPLRDPGRPLGRRAPSSEWRFHADILRDRPQFDAIVHTHSPHATALAVHGLGLPAFHYMVAAAGGRDIRCAPYATFGSQALSDHAVQALADRQACLLAHHGVIACGRSLDRALALAIEVEQLARIYLAARTLGEPPRLSDDEMDRVIARFQHYGHARPAGHPNDGAAGADRADRADSADLPGRI